MEVVLNFMLVPQFCFQSLIWPVLLTTLHLYIKPFPPRSDPGEPSQESPAAAVAFHPCAIAQGARQLLAVWPAGALACKSTTGGSRVLSQEAGRAVNRHLHYRPCISEVAFILNIEFPFLSLFLIFLYFLFQFPLAAFLFFLENCFQSYIFPNNAFLPTY